MKPVATDPFPADIEIVRGRRRTLEIRLEHGRFVGRIPLRASLKDVMPVLRQMRAKLWQRLQHDSVFDDATLQQRARDVIRRYLADLELPPFTVRFSRRQHKRWGSCSFDGHRGSIRISAHLVGHPTWVIDEVLLHEIAHLLHQDHGPAFQELVERSPNLQRGQGYLEAIAHVDRTGPDVALVLRARLPEDEDEGTQARLFEE